MNRFFCEIKSCLFLVFTAVSLSMHIFTNYKPSTGHSCFCLSLSLIHSFSRQLMLVTIATTPPIVRVICVSWLFSMHGADKICSLAVISGSIITEQLLQNTDHCISCLCILKQDTNTQVLKRKFCSNQSRVNLHKDSQLQCVDITFHSFIQSFIYNTRGYIEGKPSFLM